METPHQHVEILDTTLRDGAQGAGISFSLQDKMAISAALDELGVAWIEAGNPGANPKDMDFFRQAAGLHLKTARLCAFGATRKKGVPVEKDEQVHALLKSGTEGVTLFGKTWDFQVKEVLRVSPEENLDMIGETVRFLKAEGRCVFFDAEHYFDGFRANRAYALAALRAALEAGADRLVLCDTKGGAFPGFVQDCVTETADSLCGLLPDGSLGIHAHNDCGMAVAISALAVEAGCRHVQGTLLGFGERCGNTSLAALIPSLEIKMNLPCLPGGNLQRLTEICRRVADISNIVVPDNMPYVGAQAFSHKAGMHADGILKAPPTFEHIDPGLVGNGRRFLISEMGGRSSIAERIRALDPAITRDHASVLSLVNKLKNLEAAGWQFEVAEASFELLIRRELKRFHPFFSILGYRVESEYPAGSEIAPSHAWTKVLVDGQDEIAAAEGNGPVNALDGALRRALLRFYPALAQVRLSDYKVRVINGANATAARVRVLIESTDGRRTWSTVGVSEDIIEASCQALVDSIEYKLICDREEG
jgi:2-isopropylmalate synthase